MESILHLIALSTASLPHQLLGSQFLYLGAIIADITHIYRNVYLWGLLPSDDVSLDPMSVVLLRPCSSNCALHPNCRRTKLTWDYISYGESHCLSVGCIVDGCPPGMELTEADIQPQMTRRRPGQSALTTPVSYTSGDRRRLLSNPANGIPERREGQGPYTVRDRVWYNAGHSNWSTGTEPGSKT